MKTLKQIRNNEGFTLVELMIVLSIIAILAVVLVPRVGNMKESVREQGVNANVNSVRAFLELEINDKDSNESDERDRLVTNLSAEFTEGNAITNPFTNGDDITTWDDNNDDDEYSVVIDNHNNTVAHAITNGSWSGTNIDRRGKVAVVVCTDGYLVHGFDKDGASLPYHTVK